MKELFDIKRSRLKNPEEKVLDEARYIISYHHKKNTDLIDRPDAYYQWEKIAEDISLDQEKIFSPNDIRTLCIRYRLMLTPCPAHENHAPYAACLAMENFNHKEKKKLDILFLCHPHDVKNFSSNDFPYLAFVQTHSGKFFLLYKSKKNFSIKRKILYFPLRNFETVFLCVALLAAVLAVLLPTRLIWLPEGAPYWGTYRIAAFFHILIFFLGFTVYGLFAFQGQLSAQLWNKFLMKKYTKLH